jgi:oxygen-independent coproporphyrinogen III oxidase
MEDLLDAIRKEAHLRKNEAAGKSTTIYFGGGTPSLMNAQQIISILDTIHEHYEISEDAEVTLEANPEDISPETLQSWKNAGINRLSVGIQSFDEEELQWMNRAHTAERAMQCLQEIKTAGFSNYSVDLIFGSNHSTTEKLRRHLQIIEDEKIPHVSVYGLTVEPKTMLNRMVNEKKADPLDENRQAGQFVEVMERLEKTGFDHYEISNFSLPGHRSRHNSSYWKGIPYIGLGPSAHSYDGNNIRSHNIANNVGYIEALNTGDLPLTRETLDRKALMNEAIMISLRLMEGLDLNEFGLRFGEQEVLRLMGSAKHYIDQEFLVNEKARLILSRKGKLIADRISADLFI